ncbi:MAG: substrate-binding domain-containing protein [Planctomycetota bacterium]
MLTIDKTSHVPAYIQLKQEILRRIQNGIFKPGDKLPSVRDLVKSTGLSHLTVARSVTEMVKEGILISEKGKGTFVSSTPPSGALSISTPLNIAILTYGSRVMEMDPVITPYTYECMQGINSCITSYGFSTTHLSVDDYLKEKYFQPVDGAIMLNADSDPDEAKKLLTENKKPFVLIGQTDDVTGINYVDGSNFQGSFDAVDHLLKLGHRKIAYLISGTADLRHSQRERKRGYKEAFKANNVEVDDSMFVACEQSISNGYNSTKFLIERKDRPTAIYSSSDMNAVGAINAIQEAGLKVPEDISVIGFMALDVMANSRPFLTTVQLNMKEMGYEAVVALENIISGRRNPPVQVMVKSELLIRETTGPVKN